MTGSLHFDSINPDADINIEEAWDIETGKNFIKVGVVDTQVDTSHSDYKIEAFYNICIPELVPTPSTVVNQHYHATCVSGIIGAKRNNQIGVAGIAGGNWPTVPGVKLYNLNAVTYKNLTLTKNFRLEYLVVSGRVTTM